MSWLVAMLVATVALLSWPVLASTTGEGRFWAYVTAHAPSGTPGFTRNFALKFGREATCAPEPISNIDVRNEHWFNDEIVQFRDELPREERSELQTYTALSEAAFKYLCPVTKHFPAHPQRDLLADFPLPEGAVLNEDPILGGREFRTAYVLRQDATLEDLTRFYATHVQAGQPWRNWSWCSMREEGLDGEGKTFVWQQGRRELLLSWSSPTDSLVLSTLNRGLLLIQVSIYKLSDDEGFTKCE